MEMQTKKLVHNDLFELRFILNIANLMNEKT